MDKQIPRTSPKILVEGPGYAKPELNYTAQVVFGDFLGLPWRVVSSENKAIAIRVTGSDKFIRTPATFFHSAARNWLHPGTVPEGVLQSADIQKLQRTHKALESSLPVLFAGQDALTDKSSADSHETGIDIFGTVFFMLSRYEEGALGTEDSHGRFPAHASLAAKSGFLDRPIVDEYVEYLWALMKHLWPALERKPLTYRNDISCDVDNPYSSYIGSVAGTLKTIRRDFLDYKSGAKATRTFMNSLVSPFGVYRFEENDTFDWIMTVNEEAGNEVSFFFIVDHTEEVLDGYYNIKEKRILELMKKIHVRGHHIGLHASYGSYLNAGQMKKEANILRSVLESLGIEQDTLGNRQHYLRWRADITPKLMEEAGLSYDATPGYADRAGFRCGTSREYPLYDLRGRHSLKIRARPLTVMEGSVIDEGYMGLGDGTEAEDYILRLRNLCKKHQGRFSLLWHNDALQTKRRRELYAALVKE